MSRVETRSPGRGPPGVAQAAWRWKHSLVVAVAMGNEAVAVDRQMVARTVSELRAALPAADDLLVGLLRVAEATRTVLEVDGAGLTLVHEEGPPRWVAATDAAMELLEQVQQDFGEGPSLEAYAQDQPIRVEDLRTAPARTRIDAVVGQLHVCAVLSVPIRLADQPVGRWISTAPGRGPGPPTSWRRHVSSRPWPVSWSTPAWSWPATSWRSPSYARR